MSSVFELFGRVGLIRTSCLIDLRGNLMTGSLSFLWENTAMLCLFPRASVLMTRPVKLARPTLVRTDFIAED